MHMHAHVEVLGESRSIDRPIDIYLRLSNSLPIDLSVYLSICRSFCRSIDRSVYLSIHAGARGDAGDSAATVLPGYHPMQVLGEMLVALDELYKQNTLELTKPFPTQA